MFLIILTNIGKSKRNSVFTDLQLIAGLRQRIIKSKKIAPSQISTASYSGSEIEKNKE